MAARDQLPVAINRLYPGKTPDEMMPKLTEVLRTTIQMANHLDMAPNSIRNWLLTNGYVYDKDSKQWVRMVVADVAS